jgi:hypothetical protein
MGAVDPKTMRKWVWQFIENIADLAVDVVSNFVNSRSQIVHCRLMPPPPIIIAVPPQIIFESRLGAHYLGNDCTMMIDGTDFWIPQQGAAERGNAFASHKYAGKLALRYEIGIDILVGNLVWIQVPYPADKYNDIKIFNSVLHHYLEPGKCVEADNGYVGHAAKIKCPDNTCNPEKNLSMQARVRSWHETLNRRLKNWGILAQQVYCHDIVAHGMVFMRVG